jgi:hypothetical protein
MMKEKDAGDSWVYLLNVRDHMEEGLIKSLLAEAGIPVREKRKGSGAYMEVYMGISHTGIDLYVPSGRIDEALDIIGREDGPQHSGEDRVGSDSLDKKTRIGRIGIKIYLGFTILGVVLIVFISIIEYLMG